MKSLRTQKHTWIETKQLEGISNGFLIPIFNIYDEFIPLDNQPKQVYLTVVIPGQVKGPHLHLKRWGYFTCIKGNVKVVARIDGVYEEYCIGEDFDYITVEVPAGIPSALQNIGNNDAYIINTPSPAWHIDDQDDHPVNFEDYTFEWEKDFHR